MISKYRPKAEIYAFSRAREVCNRVNLLWGARPIEVDRALSADGMLAAAQQELLRRRWIEAGDVLAVVAGTQMASGSTNFMRLHAVTAGEARAALPATRRRRNP